jgi:hypothetical protein
MKTDPRDREIRLLENELDRDDLTLEERRRINRDIRDVERDFDDEQRWREEGQERGW